MQHASPAKDRPSCILANRKRKVLIFTRASIGKTFDDESLVVVAKLSNAGKLVIVMECLAKGEYEN
jgi:hypothetical protein